MDKRRRADKSAMNKGFTIIELIIAVFILSIAVVGIFSAFTVIVVLTADSVDRLTAAYLAQEAIEVVRNIRDTNWLKRDIDKLANGGDTSLTWLDGFTAFNSADSVDCTFGCTVEWTDAENLQADNDGDYLYLSANGSYTHAREGARAETKFKRKVMVTILPDAYQEAGEEDHIIKITALVSWDKKATILNDQLSADTEACPSSHCIEVQEVLYDWYDYAN